MQLGPFDQGICKLNIYLLRKIYSSAQGVNRFAWVNIKSANKKRTGYVDEGGLPVMEPLIGGEWVKFHKIKKYQLEKSDD